MSHYYHLEIECDKVHADVRVNDVPVLLTPAEKRGVRCEVVNKWIIDDRNSIQVKLRSPSSGAPVISPCWFDLKLSRVKEVNEKVVDDIDVINFRWPEHNVSGHQGEWDLAFQVELQPPSKFWGSAQPIEWNDVARHRALSVLVELHQALERRDMSALSSLLDYKINDLGLSHFLSESEAKQVQTEFLEMAMDVPEWSMRPFEQSNVHFHLVGNERLVWATDKDYKAPLTSNRSGGQAYGLPVYLAPVSGEWKVVR